MSARFYRFILFLVVVAALSLAMFAGCGSDNKSSQSGIPTTGTSTGTSTGTGTSGTGTGTGTSGGSQGSGGPKGTNAITNGYSYAPNSYEDGGEPYPLIFILHGLGDDAKNLLLMWAPVADAHNYLLCSLQASRTGPNGGYEYTTAGSVDEVNAMNMVDYMKSSYNVQLNKIAIFGFSNGALYCTCLAFTYPQNPFNAMIVCSGWHIGFFNPPSTKMPTYVMWGAMESSMDKSYCQQCADDLISKGWDVTTRVHSSGHTVPSGELPAIADWLDSKIP
jgi:predicted esterase